MAAKPTTTKQPKPRAALGDRIAHLSPCDEAAAWVNAQATPTKAWAACERPDWMFWLLGRSDGVSVNTIVLAACEITRESLVNVPAGEKRPLAAVELAERWAKGETVAAEDLRSARSAAWSAAWSAAELAARSAAESAWSAARSAESAAESALSAAAESAESAARSAAWSAESAWSAAQKRHADIIRKHFPAPPRIKKPS